MRLSVCVLLLSALTATAQNGQGTPNFYSRDKEAALGASLAQQAQRNATPLDSPAALAYLARLGSQLAGTVPEPRFPYTFALTAGDQSNVLHEPLSFPGGCVLVPASLLLAARDEAEFAGMLAHAMAHVAARHATRLATRGTLEQIRTRPAISAGPVAGFGSRDVVPLSLVGLAATLEGEADLMAVKMTSAAGYDPQGLARYLGRNLDNPSRDERISSILSAIGQVAVSSSGEEFLRIQRQVRETARK